MRPSPECDPRTDTDLDLLKSAAEAVRRAAESGQDTATSAGDASGSKHSAGFMSQPEAGEFASTRPLSADKPAVRKRAQASEAD